MSTQRKETRKDRWVKDLEMCLSVSPGVYHEMDLPCIPGTWVSCVAESFLAGKEQRQLCGPCLGERRVGKTVSERWVTGYSLDLHGRLGGGMGRSWGCEQQP